MPNDPLNTPNYINLEYFFYKIWQWMKAFWNFVTSEEFLRIAKFILESLIVIAMFYIIYWVIRLDEIRKERKKKLQKIIKPKEETEGGDPRLAQISKHLTSDNPSDWKLAIIEADVILDELIERMEPEGDNLGDRLKRISKGRLGSIDSAWKAHNVRNRIAHEGSAFTISRTEARRVVGMYEEVFGELGFLSK